MDRNQRIRKQRVNLLKDWWIWKLALQDALHHRNRLLLFISSLVTGIATLIAISSFNYNLRQDIDNQAKALLGADLVLYTDDGFAGPDIQVLDSIEDEIASDARFNSMVLFQHSGQSRLAQIVAIEGNYPFYGDLMTEPASAEALFRSEAVALLDENLALEYSVSTGDRLRIGELSIVVVGVVTKIPGNVNVSATFAPSVYIPYQQLEATGLVQKGSRISYRKYFRCQEGNTAEDLLARLRPLINKQGYGYETVAYRKESLGNSLENLYRFLNLLGFIALVLGSVGVASSVHIYAKEKRETVAILRCIGSSGGATFYIFFLQIFILGTLGSFIGAMLGNAVQKIIPMALEEFLPIKLTDQIAWPSVLGGLVLGMGITVLFAVWPLLQLRSVTPMAALNSNIQPIRKNWLGSWLVWLLILGFNWGFAIYQLNDPELGSYFFLGFLAVAFALLLIGESAMFVLRTIFRNRFGFVMRQSMGNLFRPNNQTLALVVVIGLGTFLISTISMVHEGVLQQVEDIGLKTRSNLIVFDVQQDQREEVTDLIEDFEIEINELIPVVTVRLNKLKGKTLNEVRTDTAFSIPNWLLYMEHLVTYRDTLDETEELLAGTVQSAVMSKKDTIFISVTELMARQLNLDLMDEVVFNLHGVALVTYVGSIRKVEWQQIQTNFAFVFPLGVLEKAPQFSAALLFSSSKEKTAGLKQLLIQHHPNVSTIDLGLVKKTVDDLIGRIAFAIRFMAFFSIITGLMVLSGSIANSKFARIKENTLLRTLGAIKKQLVQISLLEYGYLGFLSAISGVFLSVLATNSLTHYFLAITLKPEPYSLGVVVFFITALTVMISWLNLKGIINRPPLEVLRKET
jgi:putative ABC transport system permease protein